MSLPNLVVRFAVGAACALALSACAEEAPRPGVKAEAKPAADLNKPLVERVRQALASDRDIPADDIDVTADGGVVSLWGRVPGAKESRRAEQLAAAVAGVQRVENKLMTQTD
jgi:osmotically-inducible protein OsmY